MWASSPALARPLRRSSLLQDSPALPEEDHEADYEDEEAPPLLDVPPDDAQMFRCGACNETMHVRNVCPRCGNPSAASRREGLPAGLWLFARAAPRRRRC